MGTATCLVLISTVHNASSIVALLTFAYGLTSAANSGCFSSVFDNAPRTCSAVYGLANCVGMSQGILSPYVTGILLKDGADSSSASAGSSLGAETLGRWQYVWCLSAALAGAGAVVFQLVSTGEVIEGQWLVSTPMQPREAKDPTSPEGLLREIR